MLAHYFIAITQFANFPPEVDDVMCAIIIQLQNGSDFLLALCKLITFKTKLKAGLIVRIDLFSNKKTGFKNRSQWSTQFNS